ncbi:MAG: hypothetical protein JO365_26725 [Bradyrhizobium sp.]|nr:hypothetical protein [Bradyrhizobium sp.]
MEGLVAIWHGAAFLSSRGQKLKPIEASGVPLCTNASSSPGVNICIEDQSLPAEFRSAEDFMPGLTKAISPNF